MPPLPVPRLGGLRFTRCRLYAAVVTAITLLAVTRLLLIHHYVGWRFLWGGDQVPILNKEAFLRDVFTFAKPWRDMGIISIPQLSIVIINYVTSKFFELVTRQQPIPYDMPGWLANTLTYALGLLLVWYISSTYGFDKPRARLASFTALALILSYNPWSTIDTFKSYLGATSFQAFLSLALFAYYVKLVIYSAEGNAPRPWEIALAVAATVVMASSPSAAARAVATTLLTTTLTMPFIYAASRGVRGRRRLFLYLVVPLVATVTIFSLYTASGYLAALAARAKEQLGGKPLQAVLHPRYAEPIYAFAAWTSWIAHSNYMPYHRLYEQGALALLLYAWPLTALAATITILATRREPSRARRLQLLLLLVYATIFIAWSTAGNEPLSGFKTALLEGLPLLLKVYPPGIGSMYVKISYVFLIGYLLGFLADRFGARALAAGALVIAILLSTALPVFNGSVFGQYFNPSIKGFAVPSEYRYLERLRAAFYEHILLLPATGTYTSTSWGWQGSVAWYHYLNPAILVKSIAAYSQYTPWTKLYEKLVHPCITLRNPKPMPGLAAARPRIYGGHASVTLGNGTVTLHVYSVSGSTVTAILLLPHEASLSPTKYIEFEVCIEGNTTTHVRPYIYLVSGNIAGVHIFPALGPGECTVKVYRVGSPDKPWPASMYNPGRVNAIIIKLSGLGQATGGFEAHVSIMMSNTTTLCKDYVELLRLLNVKYIVIDKTLHGEGNIQLLRDALTHSMTLLFNGSVLEVYRTGISTSPVQGQGARVEILAAAPTRVKALVEPVEPGARLCVPLLNLPGVAKPLELISAKPSSAKLLYLVNESLVCAESIAERTMLVEGFMPIVFKLVYVMYIVINLLPLPLLIYVGVAAAAEALNHRRESEAVD